MGLTTFSLMVSARRGTGRSTRRLLAHRPASSAPTWWPTKTIVVALQGATAGARSSAAELASRYGGEPRSLRGGWPRTGSPALGATRAPIELGFAVGIERGAAPPSGRAAARQGRARYRAKRSPGSISSGWPCLLLTLGLHEPAGPAAQARAALVGVQPLRSVGRHAARELPAVDPRGRRGRGRSAPAAAPGEVAAPARRDPRARSTSGARRCRAPPTSAGNSGQPIWQSPCRSTRHGRRNGGLLSAGLRRRPQAERRAPRGGDRRRRRLGRSAAFGAC